MKLKPIKRIKECGWYLTGFCCKDLDSGRVWDCTAKGKNERNAQNGLNCPYPRLGKD